MRFCRCVRRKFIKIISHNYYIKMVNGILESILTTRDAVVATRTNGTIVIAAPFAIEV